MPKATRAEVYSAIDDERGYQLNKWGDANEQHETGSWILFMQSHLAKAAEASTRGDMRGTLAAIRKVSALGVACMENHGALTRDDERGL